MSKTRLQPQWALVVIVLVMSSPVVAAEADRIYRGGAVYTVDESRPWAEAIAVANGRITYVGDDAGADARVGPGTEVIELDGRMLMPGFHDAHAHLMAAGTRFLRCQLKGLDNTDAVLDRLSGCASKLEAGEWLRGTGLSDTLVESGDLDIARLDTVSGDHPAWVATFSGREVWANSLVHDMGRHALAESDPGDVHAHDTVSASRSGLLSEAAAKVLYQRAHDYSMDELRHAFRLASRQANRFGIVGADESAAHARHWKALRAAEAAGEMTLRMTASMRWNPERGVEQLEPLVSLWKTADGPLFRSSSVKLFVDGSWDRTASVLEPYPGNAGDHGRSNYGSGLAEIIGVIDAAGMNVHLHAYGDRAVRDGLDAIEAAIASNPPRERRHQIAHLALVHPDDLPRFAALGVTADIQPLWAWLDDERRREVEWFGPDRAARLIPIRSLFDAGARVAAGSDWISASMNPLYGIQVAVTRRPPDASGPAWNGSERATLAQMIRAYTLNGAWLAGHDALTGSIEVGKAADLVVLEENLFEVDPMRLKDVRVMLTVLDGEVVYEAGDG